MGRWRIFAIVAGTAAAGAALATYLAKKRGWIKFEFDPLEWAKSFWKTHSIKPHATFVPRNAEVLKRIQSQMQTINDLVSVKNYKETTPIYNEAIELLLKESFGSETMVTGFLRIELGIALRETGNYNKAIASFEKAAAHFRAIFYSKTEIELRNDAHSQYLRALFELIECLILRIHKKPSKSKAVIVKKAKETIQEAIVETKDFAKSKNFDENLLFMKAQQYSALLHLLSNEFDAAEKDLSVCYKVFGKSIPLSLRMSLTLTQQAMNKQPELKNSIETLVSLSQGKNFMPSLLRYCANLCVDIQEYDLAEKIFTETLEQLRKMTLSSTETDKTGTNVALCSLLSSASAFYLSRNNFNECFKLYDEAINIIDKSSSIKAPWVSSKHFWTYSLSIQKNNRVQLEFAFRKKPELAKDSVLQFFVVEIPFIPHAEKTIEVLTKPETSLTSEVETRYDGIAKTVLVEVGTNAQPHSAVVFRVLSPNKNVVESVHIQIIG